MVQIEAIFTEKSLFEKMIIMIILKSCLLRSVFLISLVIQNHILNQGMDITKGDISILVHHITISPTRIPFFRVRSQMF